MKKMITVVFVLGGIFILYQFFAMFLMNKHTSTYSLKTTDNAYMIKEVYRKHKKFNIYSLYIEDKNKQKFVASYDLDMNRQNQIIKDIKTYQKDNLYCIAPILKNKKFEQVLCQYNNEQVSVSYLHQIGNYEVDSFISNLKNEKYLFDYEIDKEENVINSSNNISIYNNLPSNLYITMWGYKYLYTLNKDSITFKSLLDKDSYFNDFGILCNKYYVAMNTDENEFTSFYVVNIKDGGKAKIDFEYTISKNSYFNGIYNNKIYLTDIDNKTQYMINPATEKITEAGRNKNAKFYDGVSLKDVDINTLTSEKKYFISQVIDKNVEKLYSDKNLIKFEQSYYYQDTDNSVYQILEAFPEYKIRLFKFSDLKELKILNNNLFIISNDIIYMYNNSSGLRKIASNRELLYNYKNIYDIYYS